MEVPEMEEAKPETHMTSAAAFVEGGIQQACDDSCSICLEDFSESDPLTVTTCKHEFHLQCILEWCQRSSQCPMCWQAISLKDPTSQELLVAVERERRIRVTLPRNATIFHHPTLGDFELQHLPVGATSAELEERIIQHLAAAAAMGRAHHIGRREGQRIRSSTFLPTNRQGISFNNRSPANHSSPPNQDMAGPSDFQSFSESMKSRLNAMSLMSMKYKESLSKSTREWKERLFSRNTSVMEQSIQNIAETRGENPLNDSKQPISCAASSTSS